MPGRCLVSLQLVSSHRLRGGPSITSRTPLPRASLVLDKEAFFQAGEKGNLGLAGTDGSGAAKVQVGLSPVSGVRVSCLTLDWLVCFRGGT